MESVLAKVRRKTGFINGHERWKSIVYSVSIGCVVLRELAYY